MKNAISIWDRKINEKGNFFGYIDSVIETESPENAEKSGDVRRRGRVQPFYRSGSFSISLSRLAKAILRLRYRSLYGFGSPSCLQILPRRWPKDAAKAQADTLRKAKTETNASLIKKDGSTEIVSATKLRKDDIVYVEAGEFIPGDGEVDRGRCVGG